MRASALSLSLSVAVGMVLSTPALASNAYFDRFLDACVAPIVAGQMQPAAETYVGDLAVLSWHDMSDPDTARCHLADRSNDYRLPDSQRGEEMAQRAQEATAIREALPDYVQQLSERGFDLCRDSSRGEEVQIILVQAPVDDRQIHVELWMSDVLESTFVFRALSHAADIEDVFYCEAA